MMPIAATLGAPVTEAHGNKAPKTSASRVSGCVLAVTVEVSCQSEGCRSTCHN